MKILSRLLLLFFVCMGALTAGTTVTTPYAGMVRYSVTNGSVNGRSVNYEVVVVDTLDAGVSFFLTPDNGALAYETTRQTTKNFAAAFNTELAINAHFFNTALSPETDNSGIAASNGTVYSPFETVGGLAALNISQDNFPETVTGVSGGTTFSTSPSLPYTTVATGSMLIRDGAVVNVGATDFRARTQVGASRNGAKLMFFASSSGITEQEGATILVNDFGAFHVHGFDGGGSTTMVLRTGASTQSIIAIENSFSQRAVGTNLGVQAAPYVDGIPDEMAWDADPSTPGIQQGSGVWDVSTANWQAGGVNRTWANSKTPTLGAGGGATISLGSRVAVSDMTIDGGYTIGVPGGSSFTILGNFTTTGALPTSILAPLGSSTTFTKLGNQTLTLGSSSRISMLTMVEGTIDLGGTTLSLIDPLDSITLKGGIIQNGNLEITQTSGLLDAPSGTTLVSADFKIPKLNKTGAGVVYLTGNNTWATSTVITGGTLGFGSQATVPTTAVSITSGILDLAGANANTTTLTLGGEAGAETSISTGAGTLTLGGTLTYNATNSPAAATISGKLGLGATRMLTVNDSPSVADDLTISADISGAFALTKNGAGTLVLSGANTYTSFKNSLGTTRSGAIEALGTTTLTVDAGLVDLNGYDETVTALTMGGVASTLAEVQSGNTGKLNLNGNFTYSATNNSLGAAVRGNVDLGNATRTFTVGNSINADVDLLVEASIAGTGTAGLTKAGAGRLELAGPLAIPGTFTVNNGEVLISGGNRTLAAVTLGGTAGASSLLDSGTTTLSLTGILAYSSSNNGLTGLLRGRVDLGSGLRTLTINNSTNASVDMRIEAEIAGSGGFVKGGAGTLELAGSNTLTGPISATAGVLALSHANAMGNAPSVTFNGTASLDATGMANGTLLINRAGLTVSGLGTLTGNVSLQSGRLLSPGSGILAISGNLSVSGGTVEVKVGTGSGTITSSGSVTLGGNLKVNMGSTISGTQSIPIITGSSVSGSFSSVDLPVPPAGTVYFVTVTSTQVLFQSALGTPSQLWLQSQGVSVSTNMSLDLDADGNSLLLEYALGGRALSPEPGLVTPGSQTGALQISFQWNTSATDISCIVEGSSDFSSWTTILSKSGASAWTGPASYSQGTAVNGLAPVTVSDPATSTPRFLRLKVTKP